MSQYDYGNLEAPLNGTIFFNTHLEPARDAVHSNHKGDSTPEYVKAGMIWVNDAGTPWVVNMYDGNSNVPLGTLDPATHKFTPANIPSKWAGSATGTANALEIAPDPAFTGYAAGMAFDVLITATNTTVAPTLKVNALVAKTIKATLGGGKVNLPIGALQTGMIARLVYDGTDFLLMNVRPQNQATDVATSATVNLNTALGDYIHLTGTNDVSTITLFQGQGRILVADDEFSLIHGANLILPTSEDITTAAGDVFMVRGEAAGVVRVVNYMRADGTTVGGGGGQFSESFVTSNQSITFSSTASIAHGLSESPKLLSIELVCITSQHNYAIGDVVVFDNHFITSSTATSNGIVLISGDTNIHVLIGNTIHICDRNSPQNRENITPANWNYRIRAWA